MAQFGHQNSSFGRLATTQRSHAHHPFERQRLKGMSCTLLAGIQKWMVRAYPFGEPSRLKPSILDASKQCTKTAGTYQSSHCRVTQFTTKCDIGLNEIFVIET